MARRQPIDPAMSNRSRNSRRHQAPTPNAAPPALARQAVRTIRATREARRTAAPALWTARSSATRCAGASATLSEPSCSCPGHCLRQRWPLIQPLHRPRPRTGPHRGRRESRHDPPQRTHAGTVPPVVGTEDEDDSSSPEPGQSPSRSRDNGLSCQTSFLRGGRPPFQRSSTRGNGYSGTALGRGPQLSNRVSRRLYPRP